MIKTLSTALVILFLSGCSQQTSSLTVSQEHTVMSNELKSIMHEMNMIIYNKNHSELDRDNLRRREAMNLGVNIKKLSNKIKDLNLDKNIKKKTQFNNYANELYKKGDTIYTLAYNYEIDKLEASYQNIEKTCTACHNKFRK